MEDGIVLDTPTETLMREYEDCGHTAVLLAIDGEPYNSHFIFHSMHFVFRSWSQWTLSESGQTSKRVSQQSARHAHVTQRDTNHTPLGDIHKNLKSSHVLMAYF